MCNFVSCSTFHHMHSIFCVGAPNEVDGMVIDSSMCHSNSIYPTLRSPFIRCYSCSSWLDVFSNNWQKCGSCSVCNFHHDCFIGTPFNSTKHTMAVSYRLRLYFLLPNLDSPILTTAPEQLICIGLSMKYWAHTFLSKLNHSVMVLLE